MYGTIFISPKKANEFRFLAKENSVSVICFDANTPLTLVSKTA